MSDQALPNPADDGAPSHVPSSKPKPLSEDLAKVLSMKPDTPSTPEQLDAVKVIENYTKQLDDEFTPPITPTQDVSFLEPAGPAQKPGDRPQREVPPDERGLPPEGAGVPRDVPETPAEPANEVAQLKAQVESLTNLLTLQATGEGNNLAMLLSTLTSGGKLDPQVLALLLQPKPGAQTAPPAPEPAPEAPQFRVEEVFEGVDSADLTDPANMNKLLNQVITSAVEHAMLRVPDVVTKNVARTIAHHREAEQWYRDNPEFIPHRTAVGILADNIHAANPGLDFSQVLQLLGPLARNMINIKPSETSNTETPSGDHPGISSREAVVRKPPETSENSQKRQIQHLILRGVR